ncbi:hypothetical protein [Leptospira kobayashii]|uniref:hypothetical protein n=1 Tax=Leptospira kobayashii TaxID=1917830 RepID=UPI00107F5665|nr:hypothetical protein [Leptospira kobayashii]
MVSIIRKDIPQGTTSFKSKVALIRDRLNSQYFKQSRKIEDDAIANKVKVFNTVWNSDPWVRKETQILDKLNKAEFNFDVRRISGVFFSHSYFKRIQERMNNYKVQVKRSKTLEVAFKHLVQRFNNCSLSGYKMNELDYRLADICVSMNHFYKNREDIAHIVCKRFNNKLSKINNVD